MGREIVNSVEEEDTQQQQWHNNDNGNCPETPMLALNHVSFVCKYLSQSIRLFNYGVGIHLLGMESAPSKKGKKIDPKDNHISFQCYDMGRLVRKVEEMGIEYVTAVVEDDGVKVDQLFFHDPDGNMIEICNCQNLPILPLSSSSSSSSSSCSLKKLWKSPIPSPSS
ncbi:hypothetical protein SAY87_019688 [Trapa incisa]|uniref:VOC domain-containing protein n=1 Tax=Trapa incisa TaxID=236973 RepID=A0AAN7Q2F6_9MYRT|nr:hypothetical protein SAY87_019688 [Trapa incisa]